jgi:hypothetical protein
MKSRAHIWGRVGGVSMLKLNFSRTSSLLAWILCLNPVQVSHLGIR